VGLKKIFFFLCYIYNKMSGGLMQLVAYGAQDVYLTGSPQVTFFKSLYRRYTNFAIQAIEQQFNGSPDFGRRANVQIQRNGDLIKDMYLQVDLPALAADEAWCQEVGHAMIQEVSVDIGGTRIDRQFGEWMHIWKELTLPAGKAKGFAHMIGDSPVFTDIDIAKPTRRIYVPLQFWFCRDSGCALPLIAMQYHHVRVNVELRAQADLIVSRVLAVGAGTSPNTTFQYNKGPLVGNSYNLDSVTLYVDYIFLDNEERMRFARLPHEYLIEQVQQATEVITNNRSAPRINFNHPSKFLVWVAPHPEGENYNQWFNFTDRIRKYLEFEVGVTGLPETFPELGAGTAWVSRLNRADDSEVHANPVTNSIIHLNGHERFTRRNGDYFSTVQHWQHSDNVPVQGINMYSFAINAVDKQPSGTVNFSRIDNTVLTVNFNQYFTYQFDQATPATDGPGENQYPYTFQTDYGAGATMNIYSVNFNVLRVVSGMGGLAYSN
jgi:hypothetical protein